MVETKKNEPKKENKPVGSKIEKVHNSAKIAVIRIRGKVHVKDKTEDTMSMLHLNRVNWMTVLEPTPVYMGMVQRSKDYITWGEIDPTLFEEIVEKWGRKAADERLKTAEAKEFAKKFLSGEINFKKAGIKPMFKLHPPSGGHSRAGIKKTVTVGGSLGYRGKDINELLKRMAGIKTKA